MVVIFELFMLIGCSLTVKYQIEMATDQAKDKHNQFLKELGLPALL